VTVVRAGGTSDASGSILTTDRLARASSSPVREILALTERPGVVSFAGGLPAPELFDVVGLREAFATVLSDECAGRALQYSTTEGDPALRSVIAQRLTMRGLDTEAQDLLVTSGSQQALTLVSAVLLEPGDRVLVEEPSYLAALQCFALARAVAVPVPCDNEGLDPDALDELVAEHRPKLLYTVPTFHNPTGRTLGLARRQALAAAVKRTGLWLVEDDPYGELRYDGEALPALASFLEARAQVVALSTLSKIAAPGLRLGWVRAPRTLLGPLTIAKQAADLHSSSVDQAAAARWLVTSDLDAHVARLRAAYRARRDTLLEGLAAALPPGSTFNRPEGGMFVWARLPDGWDASAILPRALERDVAYVPGAPFFSGCPDPATLRLSFTAHPPDEIRRGLERLAKALTAR
jgi:2-aminoadipate transaminase